MKNSRWHQWKKNERESNKQKTPRGRLLKDLPEWQISAKLAGKKENKKAYD